MTDSYQDPTKWSKTLRYALVLTILALIVVSVIAFYIFFIPGHAVYLYIVLVVWALAAIAFYRAYGRDYYKVDQKRAEWSLWCALA